MRAEGATLLRGGPAGSRGTGVAWEAMEETEVASPLVDPGAAPEEEMPSTELETGNIPVCAVETRTSPGEENAVSVRSLSPRTSFHHL